MAALLTYALNRRGQLVHIDEVERGGHCECVCPHCKKPLDAKNGGEIREHHFAHSHGNTCEGAYETTLHLLAKEVLMETGKIMLPKEGPEGFPKGLVQLYELNSECWDSKNRIRPDMEGVTKEGERILVEFYVTHKIAGQKRNTIIENGLKCIEVDLNFCELDKKAIQRFLLEENEFTKWVIPLEAKEHKESFSYSYNRRNPYHEKAIEFIEESFKVGELSLELMNGIFNLRKVGYDVCEHVSQSFRGVKSDLLLYRSGMEDKGLLCICLRGRRRNSNHRLPPNLRILDIIVRKEGDFNNLTSKRTISVYDNIVDYEGFKYQEK